MGTTCFVDQNRKAVPVTRFVASAHDEEMDMLARKSRQSAASSSTPRLEAWNSLRKFFHEDKAPEGLNFTKFLPGPSGLTDKQYGAAKARRKASTYRTLLVAGMHFRLLPTTTWSA